MYVVTHAELTAGYQIAQIAHAVADFALHRSDSFTRWHTTDQRILALQTPCFESLATLHQNALDVGLDVVPFYEPDLDNEITSLAFVPSEKNKKFLANLPLAGRKSGKTNKHTANTLQTSAAMQTGK